MCALRACAVELDLVLRVAHVDARVVSRAAVRAGVGAPGIVALGLLREAVGQLVGGVVAAGGALGARTDLLE